jgi:hypothetical protein
MPIQRIPLSQPIETRNGTLTQDSKCVNGYFETRNNMREFVKRPGLVQQTVTPTLPSDQGQGITLFKDNLYAVVNNILYKIVPSTGVSSVVGTLSGPILQVYFAQTLDSNYLFLHNQTNGYLVNGSTGAFTQIKNDNVASVTILTGGLGYTNPTVTFSAPSGGGTTATGTVVTTGSGVTSITVNNAGSGFTSTPTVVIGTVWSTGLTVTAGQQVYYGNNLYTYTVGGVTGATAPTFTSGTATDGTATIAFSGLVAKAVATISNGGVNAVSITQTGSGYNAAPIVSFSGGGGVSATATASWQAGVIESVAITNGGSGYTSSDNIVVTFTDVTGSGASATALLNSFPTGPFVPGAVFLDSYIFIGTVAGRIYNCDLGNPNVWNALGYISSEAEPDNSAGIVKHLNYILDFGQWSTEFFYDAAGAYPGSPLASAPSYRVEIGCKNGNSIVTFEQIVIFIGISRTTGTGVYAIDGTAPVKISTPFIDRILGNSDLADVTAYAFRMNGHPFYVLTLHDLNVTIVYDVAEKMWYQWTMWAIGNATSGIPGVYAEQYFRPSYYAGDESGYYVLDDDNGALYILSDNAYTDAGAPIYYRAVTDIIDNGTTKRKFYNRVEIVGDKAPAIMNIRFTNDDYKTWSSYRTVNLNASRPQTYQNGQGRRRAWEFLCTENQPLRLDCAEIDFEIGELEDSGVAQTQYRR